MKTFTVPFEATSWVETEPETHFPIQNLPIGLALIDEDGEPTLATRIGDYVLPFASLADAGLFNYETTEMPDRAGFAAIREALFELLKEGSPSQFAVQPLLMHHEEVLMLLPMPIPQFVDFYSGIHHASNVGKMFRPDMPPLLPNYRHLPVAYHGRASSLMVSEEPVIRPLGQVKPAEGDPVYVRTNELDFELEMGFFLGEGTDWGETIPVADAEKFMLGLVLVNDWSARDIQRWEYQPLGPFLAKSFATSISPWIVSLDALEPFRVSGEPQDPKPLPHLESTGPAHFDIQLEVQLQTQKGSEPQTITRSNARHLYWSFAQQLAHQASNGTPLEPGDLYGSGTISGPDEGTYGSLLELTWRGSKPITMDETSELRTFLEDGDELIMTGYAERDGVRIGFGEVRTTVLGHRDEV